MSLPVSCKSFKVQKDSVPDVFNLSTYISTFFLYKNVLSKSKLTNFDINILVLLRQNMLWAHNFIFFEHWDQYVHLEFSLYRIYWYNFTLQIQFSSKKDCCYMYEWISPGIELNLPLIILQVLYLKNLKYQKEIIIPEWHLTHSFFLNSFLKTVLTYKEDTRIWLLDVVYSRNAHTNFKQCT